MNRVKAFLAFWYDFVVGDDWRIAVAVVVALAATYVVAHQTSAAAWWLVPAGIVVLLPLSLFHAVRHRS
ncbi:MAG: hypothetical protein ACRDPG_07480 [Nocardioidaceae bacterium]